MILNIEETKALIERYKSIPLSEIQNEASKHNSFYSVSRALTGFGEKQTCTLCKAVKGDCQYCIHSLNKRQYGTDFCLGTKSFENLQRVQTPEQLLHAFRARAIFLKRLVKKYEEVSKNNVNTLEHETN